MKPHDHKLSGCNEKNMWPQQTGHMHMFFTLHNQFVFRVRPASIPEKNHGVSPPKPTTTMQHSQPTSSTSTSPRHSRGVVSESKPPFRAGLTVTARLDFDGKGLIIVVHGLHTKIFQSQHVGGFPNAPASLMECLFERDYQNL